MSDSRVSRRAVLEAGAASLVSIAAARITSPTLAQLSTAESSGSNDRRLLALIEQRAEPLPKIEDVSFARFIDRFGSAKVILLGESTHGTDEFYRGRAAITERLAHEHGFNIVAVEADWPDAARIDAYIRGHTDLPSAMSAFQRFPVWMWRNRAVRDFVDRLREINSRLDDPRKVGFYGLDLYSLPSSMDAVVDYVKRYDPQALKQVHERYGCLTPYKDDPEAYGALARNPALDFLCGADNLGHRRDIG